MDNTEELTAALAGLEASMAELPSALVAYSGGVDSALVATVAHRVLGTRMLAVTAWSPSLPLREREAARSLARAVGFPHREITTQELENASYAANPANRCYFCKAELFSRLETIARAEGYATLMDGFNADDRRDHRPGHQAAVEHAAISPLARAGLGKDRVRALARHLGLAVWDKPAAPCLASRIPYGTPVTAETLARIEAGEDALWQLGFQDARVRHHGELARVEVPPEALEQAFARREAIVAGLKAAGYLFVALDLEGYRLGSLNRVLTESQRVTG